MKILNLVLPTLFVICAVQQARADTVDSDVVLSCSNKSPIETIMQMKEQGLPYVEVEDYLTDMVQDGTCSIPTLGSNYLPKQVWILNDGISIIRTEDANYTNHFLLTTHFKF